MSVLERTRKGSLEQRLAVRRGVCTAIGAIVEGFLNRLDEDQFEPANRHEVVRHRLRPGHVILHEALMAALPQYAAVQSFDVEVDPVAAPNAKVAARDVEATARDPYRTIDYEADVDQLEQLYAEGSIEAIVSEEARLCYNQVVGMFFDGSADEVHELEGVLRDLRKRYRDIVSLQEIKAANPVEPTPTAAELAGHDEAETPALVEFFEFVLTGIFGGSKDDEAGEPA